MGRILDTGDIAAATGGESAITDIIGAFNSVKSEMTDFVDNQALKGQGWDSARNVINNVFQVLTNAYTMWGELILEANAKLGTAASKLKNGFIDEDALKHQIAMIKSNIVTVQYEMQAAQMYPASTAADAAAAASMVSACQFRIRELEKQQKKIQEELDSLDEFDSATSGLYAEAMALQSQINGLLTNVTNKGTWSTPTGLFTTEHLNMNLVKSLKTAYNQYKNRKEPKITIKWTEINGIGQQYPRVYVDGKFSQSKTQNLFWAMQKVGWAKLKKYGPEFIKELVGINDVKTLLDPKSTLAQDGMSLFSLFITYFPPTKAVKLYKGMEAAKLLSKGITTVAELEKVSKVAGLTAKESKVLQDMWLSDKIGEGTIRVSSKIDNIALDKLPYTVQKDFANYSKSDWLGNYKGQNSAYKAGKTYKNGTAPKLPEMIKGQEPNYQEFDTGDLSSTGKRGPQRFVRDKNSGTVFYTDDHYSTWKEVIK
ncbi:T7SS effector LXG polymorphic toxin [Lactovum odontotermitis]